MLSKLEDLALGDRSVYAEVMEQQQQSPKLELETGVLEKDGQMGPSSRVTYYEGAFDGSTPIGAQKGNREPGLSKVGEDPAPFKTLRRTR